jgi:hypothetical protein
MRARSGGLVIAVVMIGGDSRHARFGQSMWRACWAALLTLICALTAQPASAQNIGVAQGHAQAVVVAPLTLVKVRDMDFGKILPSTAAGTVTINPVTNACTNTGGARSFGNACRAAVFAGMGKNPFKARITMSNITQLTGPGAAMTMDTFIVGANSSISFTGNTNAQGNGNGLLNGGGNQRYQITSSSGIFTLNLGATLHVNANQAPGNYTGTFSVTVQYN